MIKTIMLYLILIVLTKGMQRYLWHHGMSMLIPIVPHDQKSHVAPHFNCLSVRNTVVPLMISLESLAADASMNGIT